MSVKRFTYLDHNLRIINNIIVVAYRLTTVCVLIMFCLYADNKVLYVQMSEVTTHMRMRIQLLRALAQVEVLNTNLIK